MSKPLAKSTFTVPRLKAVLVAAREDANAARLEMRAANRTILRALLLRDDRAALEGREREQVARVALRRSNEIITAALAELAEMNARLPALDPSHMASNPDALLTIIRNAITAELA
ncbi:MAG: hypothetical protein KIT48_12035 [Pseudolabrys sp.]|nr:hypothetical protein [Pseudolabrys sp.]